MARQLQASKTTLTGIRITPPGEIIEEITQRPVEGKILVQYIDLYESDENRILTNRTDKIFNFSELDPQQLVMVENLIRAFEDQGKARLGLV